MKAYKVKPSHVPVTSIPIDGLPHHYFHSHVLGRCRAIIIAENENLPMSKGDKLETLMRCNDRLAARFDAYWLKLQAARDSESKAYWLTKATRVQRAMVRVNFKIANLFDGAD